MRLYSIIQNSQASIEKQDIQACLRLVMPEEPKHIMEIGMFHGWSAKNWIDAFAPKTFIGIDNCHRPEGAFEYEGFNYLWSHDSHDHDTLEEVKAILGENMLDFLFIDAGHTLEDVTRDFELYSPFVRRGGIIAFHDILFLKQDCNVKPLWEELKRNYWYIELNLGPASTGFGIIINEKVKEKIIHD